MNRLDLVRIIEKNGAIFIRHGSDHDWYKIRIQVYLNLDHVIEKLRNL